MSAGGSLEADGTHLVVVIVRVGIVSPFSVIHSLSLPLFLSLSLFLSLLYFAFGCVFNGRSSEIIRTSERERERERRGAAFLPPDLSLPCFLPLGHWRYTHTRHTQGTHTRVHTHTHAHTMIPSLCLSVRPIG